MKARSLLIFLCIFVCLVGNGVVEASICPQELFQKVQAKYRSLETYKAEGFAYRSMEQEGVEIDTSEIKFTMLLKKPNLYKIVWGEPIVSTSSLDVVSAVWSDGDHPYIYLGNRGFSEEQTSDRLALAGATGISWGIAFHIPSLFFAFFDEDPPVSLGIENWQYIDEDVVDGEECYVMGLYRNNDSEQLFWVSKERHLIIKIARKSEFYAEAQQDENGDTEEKEDQEKTLIKYSSHEVHQNITHPELETEDFIFEIP